MSKGEQRPFWNWDRRAVIAILTLGHLSLLPDVPGIQGCPFLGLHGSALVKVLWEVGLVQTSSVHHLTLRDVVLLEVRLHHLCYSPGILSGRNRKHFSGERDQTPALSRPGFQGSAVVAPEGHLSVITITFGEARVFTGCRGESCSSVCYFAQFWLCMALEIKCKKM